MAKRFRWAAALALGISFAASAADRESTHDEMVHLTDLQVERGNFQVDAAGPARITRHITVPGSVVPDGDHVARVAVRLLGTVAELRRGIGDEVKTGDVLAVIESREIADAKSEYLGARIVFDLQQTLFNRAVTLHDAKVMSDNDFLRNRTSFEDARVKIETARQKLFALNLTTEQIEALPQQPPALLRRQELRAPISGRVAERRVELGSLVGREGQESELFVIVDPSRLWADLAVAPAALDVIREGQRITISGNGRESPATVTFISPLLDKETRSARIVASIDNAARLWRPGMFISADIVADEADAPLAVPKAALQTLGGDTVVFVREQGGFAVRRVALGRRDNARVEVISGLATGERIATANTFVLKAELGKAEMDHQD
jgi:cobalt-zinc-cadmium efflux system membrane fusion protein